MKKTLFTLLVGSFCALQAMDKLPLTDGEHQAQLGVPVTTTETPSDFPVTWVHDLDKRVSVRTSTIGDSETQTTFKITGKDITRPQEVLPSNPTLGEWYQFYLTGTLDLVSDKGEEVNNLPFKSLLSELALVRSEIAATKGFHYFDSEHQKEISNFNPVKRYDFFECVCSTYRTDVMQKKDGNLTILQQGIEEVVHATSEQAQPGTTNPEAQGVTKLPNRKEYAGTTKEQLIVNTVQTVAGNINKEVRNFFKKW